jgi:hypothetical protein
MPPDVVRMRASSTVFVKASSRVNLDLTGMVPEILQRRPRKMRLIYHWCIYSRKNGK